MRLNLIRIAMMGLQSGFSDLGRQIARIIDNELGVELKETHRSGPDYQEGARRDREREKSYYQSLVFHSTERGGYGIRKLPKDESLHDFPIISAGVFTGGGQWGYTSKAFPAEWVDKYGEGRLADINWKKLCENENQIKWVDREAEWGQPREGAWEREGVRNYQEAIININFRDPREIEVSEIERDIYGDERQRTAPRGEWDKEHWIQKKWDSIVEQIENIFKPYLGPDTAIWVVGDRDLQESTMYISGQGIVHILQGRLQFFLALAEPSVAGWERQEELEKQEKQEQEADAERESFAGLNRHQIARRNDRIPEDDPAQKWEKDFQPGTIAKGEQG